MATLVLEHKGVVRLGFFLGVFARVTLFERLLRVTPEKRRLDQFSRVGMGCESG